MSCCQALASEFDERRVAKELSAYRRSGPEPTTRALLQALRREGARGTLLDVGGGLGAIPAALVEDGIVAAVNLEASPAYLEASRTLAVEGGYLDRLDHRLGDFVALAPTLEPADVVTLDRVICCYPALEPLVELSAARARALYGFVVPRDRWLVRLGNAIRNLGRRLVGNPFRTYIHPIRRIDGILRRGGLEPRSLGRTFSWEIRVYGR